MIGDTVAEPNETFFVNLSHPVGATIVKGQGIGTIRNDDAAATPTPTPTPIGTPPTPTPTPIVTPTPTPTPIVTPTPTSTPTPTPMPTPQGHIVISQLYGAGGDAGSVYKNDFIELFNPGVTAVDLSGWSVQYSNVTDNNWQVTNLTNVQLLPRQYYLVQEAGGTAGSNNLPAPDAIGPTQMDARVGKVALVRTATPLTGSCPFRPDIEDFVGYGPTANCFEGQGPAPAPSNIVSDWRAVNRCQDTNQNINDFLTGVPKPRNTSVFGPCTTVQFSDANYGVNEGAGSATITVTRAGDTGVTTTVDYATSDGTADQKKHYITTSGTLTFAPSETIKTFKMLIIDEAFVEGPHTINLTLSNPTNAGYSIPDAAVLTINDNDTTAPTSNPIDTASFFVRQQYLDFFSREPDAAGLSFRTNNIIGCTPQPSCLNIQRVNTSAAFFLSIEFQQTGYLIVRMYKAAYGDASGTSTFPTAHTIQAPIVRFSEFLNDTQEIGQGVIVGQTGWEIVLENNKQAFASEFVQRARFASAYPTSTTPAQFVDALFANAGVTPSATDRNAAISEFGSATNTSDVSARARSLRRVAENATLTTNEFNRAFVLMQYFGYLRRNPNDPQNNDYTGYDFWLTKLNQFNGNFVAAEMVKAFITSTEYRQRFGP